MIRRPPRSTLFPSRRSSDLRIVGEVVVKNDGWRRTLQAIHPPPITISSAPTSTVGGVLAGPIVAAYTTPKGYMNTGAAAHKAPAHPPRGRKPSSSLDPPPSA